jgi:polysaccharide biosynthesis protein PslG
VTIRIRALAQASLALVLTAMLLAPAVAEAAKAPPTFFGISSQTALASQDYTRMSQGNIGILRMPFGWQTVQPAGPGTFDWSAIDPVVGGAATAGLTVEPFISGSPDWSAHLDGYSCASGQCVQFAPKGAAALAAWKDFVTAAVARYGPSGSFWTENPTIPKTPIHVWQIWNEMNSSTFFKPTPNPSQYADVLTAASAAVRAVDPGADVILGGMAGLSGSKRATPGVKYLTSLYKISGLTSAFDGVAVHPYGTQVDAITAQVEDFRAVMKKAHDSNTGLWVTEFGWGSKKGGNPLNVGTKGQADRVSESYKYFTKNRKKLKIQTVDWFSWMDSSTSICAWCSTSGLFKAGLVAKPSWTAFVKFSGGS